MPESGTTSTPAPEKPSGVQQFLAFLEGKKTYLVAAIGILYVFGGDQGWWVLNESIMGILGFSGLAALRASKKEKA